MIASINDIFMNAWPAGVIMLVLGTAFSIILLLASKKLKVEVDPKVEQVAQALPGIDCGACGFGGCAAYAKAVVAEPSLIGKCAPGGPDCAAQIGMILNLEVSGSGPAKRPIVHCRAHTEDKNFNGQYVGIQSCIAANAVPNVQMCKFGCLGYGDCVTSCQFDALHIVDGLATVDYQKCTGCGACEKACPRDLIKMVGFAHENMITVACSNQESGKDTRNMCDVGCIACKMCTKQSDEVFTMNENCAEVNYEKYQPCEQNETALKKCPTGVIVYRGKNAPKPKHPAKEKKKKAEAAAKTS